MKSSPKELLKIGITGGIGSGKSTICQIFEVLGVPVYYADDSAKSLMNNDLSLVNAIKKTFGDHVYDDRGQLDRQVLASLVFNDKKKLKKLESLVHPAVFAHSEAWIEQQAQKNVPYILKEAALIFESGSYQQLDKVITVFAPESVRIQRVKKRDNTSEAAIKARMDKQLSEEEKKRLANFIIYNDNQQALIPQVLKIHQELIRT